METKEIARRLLEIDSKIDTFASQLEEIGIDIDASALREIDIVELTAELFGISPEEAWHEYGDYDGSPETADRFLDRLATFAKKGGNMNAKYKVRFFVECMVVVEVERDRKMSLEVIAREVYGETDFGEEVKKGNVKFTDSVVAYMVDEYDAKGELVEPGECIDIDDKFLSGEG